MLPVKQGMKRQIMQEIMGHHDEVTRLKLVPNRGKQLFVQLAKMRCSVETPGGEAHVAGFKMRSRELKLEQPEKVAHP